jgi:hypothetical protein
MTLNLCFYGLVLDTNHDIYVTEDFQIEFIYFESRKKVSLYVIMVSNTNYYLISRKLIFFFSSIHIYFTKFFKIGLDFLNR